MAVYEGILHCSIHGCPEPMAYDCEILKQGRQGGGSFTREYYCEQHAHLLTVAGYIPTGPVPYAGPPKRITAEDEAEARGIYTCPKCGATNLPYNMLCDACQYATRPRAVWDGHAMLYSYTANRFYASLEDADDWLEDGQTVADLRLVICEPNMARELSSDYWEGEMEADDRLPPALEDAIDAVNAVVATLPPLSWSPGRYAVDLSNVAGVVANDRR